MLRLSKLLVCCLTLGACNAEAPTALADINPAAIHGKWGVAFSAATCTLSEIQVSFTQFSSGGALPDTIRLVGSWQAVGNNTNTSLSGRLIRDTGYITLQLIEDVRWMEGIVLDEDNMALAYTDVSTPCRARAAMKRLD